VALGAGCWRAAGCLTLALGDDEHVVLDAHAAQRQQRARTRKVNERRLLAVRLSL
jgi:predicted kinase